MGDPICELACPLLGVTELCADRTSVLPRGAALPGPGVCRRLVGSAPLTFRLQAHCPSGALWRLQAGKRSVGFIPAWRPSPRRHTIKPWKCHHQAAASDAPGTPVSSASTGRSPILASWRCDGTDQTGVRATHRRARKRTRLSSCARTSRYIRAHAHTDTRRRARRCLHTTQI